MHVVCDRERESVCKRGGGGGYHSLQMENGKEADSEKKGLKKSKKISVVKCHVRPDRSIDQSSRRITCVV